MCLSRLLLPTHPTKKFTLQKILLQILNVFLLCVLRAIVILLWFMRNKDSWKENKLLFNLAFCIRYSSYYIVESACQYIDAYRGGSSGGNTRRAPLLKLEKIWFFGVKSWFFTRNTLKMFAPPSAIGKNIIFWRKIVIFHTKYPKNFRASLRSAQFFLSAPL